jgi:hypothetical protein
MDDTYHDRYVEISQQHAMLRQRMEMAVPAAAIFTSVESEEPVEISAANTSIDDEADKRKYSKSGLTGTTAENLHQELTKIMEKEKLFSESELSLADLARQLNTHPTSY